MRINNLKRLTRERRMVLGASLQIPSPHLVEILGYAGFGFVQIDTEHGPYEMEMELTNLIRACEVTGMTPLVRLTEVDPARIMKALDAGAQGIIVPRVRTREDIDQGLLACKYPPMGDRGTCGNVRAAQFSRMDKPEYFRMANEETMIVALIEEAEAVERIDEILAPGGIDLVAIGPGDMSSSMGYPGQMKHPAVTAALERVVKAAHKYDIPVRALATLDDPEWMQFWIDRGVRVFMVAVSKTIYLAMNGLVERTMRMGG